VCVEWIHLQASESKYGYQTCFLAVW
jgi:hypothetical protein